MIYMFPFKTVLPLLNQQYRIIQVLLEILYINAFYLE